MSYSIDDVTCRRSNITSVSLHDSAPYLSHLLDLNSRFSPTPFISPDSPKSQYFETKRAGNRKRAGQKKARASTSLRRSQIPKLSETPTTAPSLRDSDDRPQSPPRASPRPVNRSTPIPSSPTSDDDRPESTTKSSSEPTSDLLLASQTQH
ncbi:uncharacterized protein A4U43_C04F14770 [Asparagus officinalis]|uniref:Uncharacterized protein n=1 Tax=Asparagus officinalis TaxID=4686 RepID=A0A5P1F0W7_ASPOF|nr:uncharacterized protein A4U43_C04F14770 [Asparagus officinalis]